MCISSLIGALLANICLYSHIRGCQPSVPVALSSTPSDYMHRRECKRFELTGVYAVFPGDMLPTFTLPLMSWHNTASAEYAANCCEIGLSFSKVGWPPVLRPPRPPIVSTVFFSPGIRFSYIVGSVIASVLLQQYRSRSIVPAELPVSAIPAVSSLRHAPEHTRAPALRVPAVCISPSG